MQPHVCCRYAQRARGLPVKFIEVALEYEGNNWRGDVRHVDHVTLLGAPGWEMVQKVGQYKGRVHLLQKGLGFLQASQCGCGNMHMSA